MPEQRGKSKLGFIGVLWIAVAIAAGWLLGWPLIMNAWAASHWKQIPCHVMGESIFYYKVDNVKFESTRRDFWKADPRTEKGRTGTVELPDNDVCWVSPSNPLNVVLRLDALSRLSAASGRLACASLLIVVAAAFTVIDRRKKAAARKRGA